MVAVGNKIVVAPVEVETKTPSGIYLPDSTKERPQTGRVVAVGPRAEMLAVGQTVMYSKYGGSEITVDGAEYIVLTEDDIYVILDANRLPYENDGVNP